MNSSHIDIVRLYDTANEDEAFVNVRVAGSLIGLTLSLRKNGDIELFLTRNDAARVAHALQKAIAKAESAENS